MNEIVTTAPEDLRRAERIQVMDSIPVLDTGRFEHMQRIASVMAQSSMIPEALYCEGSGNDKKNLPLQAVISNCFLVVNQSVRWGMDPFAVAQCVSVIKGKICYEGKLIAAVLDAKLGIRLVPEYHDEGRGDSMGVTIYAYSEDDKMIVNPRNGEPLTVKGTVGEWKTTGTGSPWGAAKAYPRMLLYRGSREWTRFYRPAIMLGVYAEDEIDEMDASHRAREAIPKRRAPAPTAPQIEHQPEPAAEPAQAAPQATERRRAPAPTATPQPAPKAADAATYDPEAVRARFETAAKAATDANSLDHAWETIVYPFEDTMLDPDKEDLLAIYRGRESELNEA